MSTVLDRETKQLHRSVNEPDFPVERFIHEPIEGLASVLDFPTKYWVITGDVVTLMDQAARDAVDAQEVADALAADRTVAKDRYDDRDFKALALVIMDELNILRAEHALNARTPAQLKSAHSAKVDTI